MKQQSLGQELDGAASMHNLLARPAPHGHIVQFYEDDRVLVANIARFVTTGVRCGQPIVIIASVERRAAIAAKLRLDGVNVDQLLATEQLVVADAADMLATFMDGETPSWDRFRITIGGLLERGAGGQRTCVRAYGEMVELLWQRGQRAAAIQVEQFWNDLAGLHTFSLLCAYAMGNFVLTADGELLEHVCRAHGHVLPAEPYPHLDADDRGRQLVMMQQRARALDAEVAHRQQLERELRDALAREAANAATSARYHALFAAMLGHDLRNQLGAVMMSADYIARLQLGDKPARNASRVAGSAVRMSRMIDQLLTFLQVWVGGGLDMVREPVDLAKLCHRVKDELEGDHPAWSIALDIVGDTTGAWDAEGLLRVLTTLVSNAITHGTGACEVALWVDGRAAGELVAEIRNGGAIAPALVASMFEPYWGDRVRHKSYGVGLGLFIAKQIVHAHAGTIAVSSYLAQGTTVRVTLPRRAAAADHS